LHVASHVIENRSGKRVCFSKKFFIAFVASGSCVEQPA
jgi:hypothetical protein